MKIVFFILLLIGAMAQAADRTNTSSQTKVDNYEKLLRRFPEDEQGLGRDTFFKTIEPQPMTYGLVLSAESLHFKNIPNDESRRRIRKAVEWLVKNNDADGDGKPGWGLPQPWDAFSDRTTNGPNTPYTITSAIVLNGFLDALSIPNFWTKPERQQMENLMRRVVLRWCMQMWSEGHGGGFFWYSPNRCDAIFSVNAPAMYLGAMTRFVNEHKEILKTDEKKIIRNRADSLAQAIVFTVHLRNGCPFWDYAPKPNSLPKISPNDLVHQAYILWGIETYRDFHGRIKIPWRRQQSLQSLDRFLANEKICNYAQDEPALNESGKKSPSPLWGAGMALAFDAKYGAKDSAEIFYRDLVEDYHLPELRLSPKSTDTRFYPRHAAHALFGMACLCFVSK